MVAAKRIHLVRAQIEAEFELQRQKIMDAKENPDILGALDEHELMAMTLKWFGNIRAGEQKRRVSDTGAWTEARKVDYEIELRQEEPVTAVKLCAKAGNFPYNKVGGTATAWVETDRIIETYDYRGASLVILRPVIDKLVFDYRLADCGAHKRAIQGTILKNVDKIIDELPALFKPATKENVGGKRFRHLDRAYERNFILRHKATGSKSIIQIVPRKKTGGFLRCDINPARLGPEGMAFLRDFLGLLTHNEWKDIGFDAIAKTKNGIRRIDIAVDMLGVDASDLEGRYIFKGKTLKKKAHLNPTGRTETMYFQKPENDKNQAYWYNKAREITDKTGDPLEGGQKSPYGRALHTRFEYRVEDSEKPIANLKSLTNHLTKVQFRAVDYEKIKEKDFTHALFLRYAITRTGDKALDMIPVSSRVEYKDSLAAAMLDIWKPKKIWENGWHAELISLGLLDPSTLKKKKSKKKN